MHRGPHPADEELFSLSQLPRLAAATDDLSWLLGRGYAAPSSIKLVGDRYSLVTRQRVAVGRCACASEAASARRARQVAPVALRGEELWIDGYNVLTSVEAAMAGGVILVARDGCYRDMASMHGSYRKVAETLPAILHLGEYLSERRVHACHWLFDQPVSNSGRLKTMLRELAQAHRWPWTVELVPDPDTALIRGSGLVASADSHVIQHCDHWFNLAREVIERRVPSAWLADLANSPQA